MKLLNFYEDTRYFIIETDEGKRKVLLSWKGIDRLKIKCEKLLGKEIATKTYGNFDKSIWFSDIEEVDHNENFIRENDLSTFREQLSFHKSYEKKTSQKIYGPPGTGKTKTLIDKIEYHIEQGIKPNEIAFLTYSNQAAEIAKERIIQKFPNLTLNDFPYFSTIHSFATKLGGLSGKSLFTEEFYKRFDTDIIVNKQMTALADIESLKDRVTHPILDQLTSSIQSLEELDDEKFFKIRNQDYLKEILTKYFSLKTEIDNFNEINNISLNKNSLKSNKMNFYQLRRMKENSSNEFLQKNYVQNYWNLNLAKYCNLYIDQFIDYKKVNNLVDFNDVILKVADNNFTSDRIPNFELLIIDEAQDLSLLLWKFIRKFINNARITYLAGDDDQSIMRDSSFKSLLNLKTSEKDIVLAETKRIPKEIKKYLDNGIIKVLNENKNRKEKEWLSRKSGGDIKLSHNIHYSITELVTDVEYDIHESNEIDYKSDWLIMAPTKNTGIKISEIFKNINIPHFYRNKSILNASKYKSIIKVQTIHMSKGEEANNVAIVFASLYDIQMVINDIKLAYVALTRSKKILYPSVLLKGLNKDKIPTLFNEIFLPNLINNHKQ